MNTTLSAADLLAQAEAAGLLLWWEGDENRVCWAAPRELDRKPWLGALRACKAELTEVLRARADRQRYRIGEIVEFDALVDRLAELWNLPAEKRTAMREARRRMAPCRVKEELAAMREQVTEAEALLATLERAVA